MKCRLLFTQQQRCYAKMPYNKSYKYDWKPLKDEFFAKAPPPPINHEHRNKSKHRAYIPVPEEDEFVERPPLMLPTIKLLDDTGEIEDGGDFKVVAPLQRVARRNRDGSASAAGGRKTARAHAYVRPSKAKGDSVLTINGKSLIEYFPMYTEREMVLEPLLVTETLGDMDFTIKAFGGGKIAQAGAARMALGRALQRYDPSFRWSLKIAGCLTRDARTVERKKTGKKKARKSKQWSKR